MMHVFRLVSLLLRVLNRPLASLACYVERNTHWVLVVYVGA